ncbi:hypothetical protein [Shewanella sp. CG12_big_fil_rev_8_21_14_0_65_47_15]|uniref:hypothetical protein n=1 Tax=Shewanella sp. CG12_big_fil_rev_8_21_14_0_65_47_15 TaxID=1975537 RepID=UPI000CCB671C|nr:hypothetical protein [Shewanella sp. CG12_big_fil_rev_8_21_14_0_65_47_15]PIW60816.1 MAG: hypothetical protein COW15_11210 [Shewanella sp. CG12_big_fil_rev_8_21_14_0_65_47_15]
MDEQTVSIIAGKVVSDVSFWTALIGLGGVTLGAVIAIIGNIIIFKMQNKQQKNIDTARKELLSKMLSDTRFEEGRSLDTLSTVTGSQPEGGRRLLIEIGARGLALSDGREGWAYIKNRPLSTQ